MAITDASGNQTFTRTLQTGVSGQIAMSHAATGANISMKRNIKDDYEKFGHWLNGIDVTHQNLTQFDPYIRGVSRLFVYRTPFFMEKLDADMTKRWRDYMEVGYTAIDGISNLTVDFVDFEGGFSGQRFSNVSLSKDETDTINIRVYELSGSPMREFLEMWISGVRDPRSGIAHYHGIIDSNDETCPYGEINHTAEFIYVTLDPTHRQIEYACMLAHAFPGEVAKDHYNYEKGDRSNVELTIPFRCTKYESPAINEIAAQFIAADATQFNYLDFDPSYDELLLQRNIGVSNIDNTARA